VIVCDTGPLVAVALRRDQHHRECTDLFTGLHLARRRCLVPGPVVAEVGYLLREGVKRALGDAGKAEVNARVAEAEAAFLESLAAGDLTPYDLTQQDYRRAAELVRKYGDLPLGTTDACVAAVAERLEISEIATTDRRDLSRVRTTRGQAFTLLPEPRPH
jgi:predicted nucleic acid-binding protein